MTLYHIYLDEGGLFGKPKLKITKKKLRENNIIDHHITQYYMGKMKLSFLQSYVNKFNRTFPNLPILMEIPE